MKVMLVGGFGFIGSRFIKKFHKKYHIIVLSKKHTHENFLQDKNISNVSVSIADVTKNLSTFFKLYEPDIVIHLAALTGISKCKKNIDSAFSLNVCGTFNVIMECISNNIPLIFFSSREVYGQTDQKTDEDSPLLPKNVYGVTKMVCEHMIQLAHKKYNLPFTILRPTNVYGPGGDNYGAQIIIKDALKGEINLMGGNQIINYVYVDDVVDLLDKIIENKKFKNEIYNVGSEYNIPLTQFASMVISKIKNPVIIKNTPMRQNETLCFIPDNEKLHTVFNIKQKSLESGLEETINWYSKDVL